jgi:hypothetical protein
MNPVVYHRLAASELIKGGGIFYGRRNPTLGEAFLSTVDATLPQIQPSGSRQGWEACNPAVGKRTGFPSELSISNSPTASGLWLSRI